MLTYERLQEWVSEGRRYVEVKMDSRSGSVVESCWVYDYNAMAGATVREADKLPTTEELKARTIAEIEFRLAGLKGETR